MTRKWIFPALAVLAAVFAVAFVACGDDDEGNGATATPETATPSVCDQKDALDQSVEDLENLDVTAEGTNGLTAAVEAVAADLEALAETASAEIEPEVEDLQTAVSDAEETLSGIPDDATLNEQIDAVQEAFTEVGTAAAALDDSLQADCP